MSPTSDLYGTSNPPSPPPPEYDAMISKMTGAGFDWSAPGDVITQHSFTKPILPSKPSNGPSWPKIMDVDNMILSTSKFSDKLNTNYIPSPPEISEVKSYVAMVNEKVAEYDTRITELEATLTAIKQRRAELHAIVTAHEALVSPLRRLPPEILQIIFAWCLSQNRNSVMHASEAPVLLGRICSEWRRISIGTPELWASLHIVPPNVNFSNPTASTARFQRKRDLIKMWLDRSGACPLSISLVWFAGDSEEEITLCGTLLEVLRPLCGRWKVLDFQVPLKMFKPFIGLSVQDVPYLEGLSLMDNRTPLDTEAVDRWPDSLAFAENATRLRSFTLTFFSGGIRLPTVPWQDLTMLYLESNIAFFFRDSRDMLTTLARCTSLISCTLKFPLSHTASLPAYDSFEFPVTMPELQVLCIDGDQHLHNTFHMSNTLVNLCAPRLRRLEILGRSGRPEGSVTPEPLSAIKTLLQRSKCPLEKLNVESMTMVPEEFIACLRLVPTLIELTVHNWSVRITSGLTVAGDETADANEVAENQILRALTISDGLGDHNLTAEAAKNIPKKIEGRSLKDSFAELKKSLASMDASCGGSKSIVPTVPSQHWPPSSPHPDKKQDLTDLTHLLSGPLCPNLERFDFTLCDASQSLLCDFVASRWNDLPEGVSKIKMVKCNFTAFEDDDAKARMQKFKEEGLDAFVTYQVPINDDMNPSPWTGLEGPP